VFSASREVKHSVVLLDSPPEFDEAAVQAFVAADNSYMERARADITRRETLLRKEEVDVYPNLRMEPSYQSGQAAAFGAILALDHFRHSRLGPEPGQYPAGPSSGSSG